MNAIAGRQTKPESWAQGAGAFVLGQISRLQTEISKGRAPRSDQVAALAKLRRGLGKEIGELPELLEYVVNPDGHHLMSDTPTPIERATYTAMTLYALHQQSQSEPMHISEVRFAEALGSMRFRQGEEVPGVTRRFQAMATSVSLNELVHHCRGLITLMRREGQGFDYQRFTQDLVRYQSPLTAKYVRLSWGRDFYRFQEKKKE